jgi:8-oxo-dGTP diphosphatase
MAEDKRPKVGVGVVIHDGAGNIVMGMRMGSHGAGKFSLPYFFRSQLDLCKY